MLPRPLSIGAITALLFASACATPAIAPTAPPAGTSAANSGSTPAAAAGGPTSVAAGAAPANAGAGCPNGLRKLSISTATTPPNVALTAPFVARGLGYFGKHCIDADIVEFEGGLSATSRTAVAQGSVMGGVSVTDVGQGVKVHEVWVMAPHLPQSYEVGPDVKAAADLKGKKLSAAGGGVGSFNWVMGREVLKTANLTVDDVQFIPSATAGRLPGLVAGQVDAVALHPEDVYLAEKQKPGVHTLVVLKELLPNYVYNAYGVADSWAAKDPDLIRDAVAALMEANRAIYQNKDAVVPIMMDATQKDRPEVEFAWDWLTRNCVFAVNTGYLPEATAWSAQLAVDNGDVPAAQKPTPEQVFDQKISNDALALVGGPTTVGNCKD
ncbi:MAG: ABC transporter substrate-binding protein [Chloroflexi bacterium]|nr:ABC transporter substrate-binding protein [Chloroflexota bacterium]